VKCRRVEVQSAVWQADLLAALCSILRRREGLIAVASPYGDHELLVVGRQPLTLAPVRGRSWQANLRDQGEALLQDWKTETERNLIGALAGQALALAFERAEGYWRLRWSTRQWYRDQSEATEAGVEVVSRIAFAIQAIGESGIGIAFDAGHLFRTARTVDDFLDPTLREVERKKRRREFDRLRARSERRKGTMLYDTGRSEVGVCYFERFGDGETCDSVGPVLNDRCLYDYYQHKYPDLPISPEDRVAYVSFRDLPHPVPVAARLLRLRVMIDKERSCSRLAGFKTMPPSRRKEETEKAWEICRATIEAKLGVRFEEQLWRPSEREQELLPCPVLQFGSGRTVDPPQVPTLDEYKRYYEERMRRLRGGGLYRFEPSVERRLFVVAPTADSKWSDELQKAFLDDVGATLRGFVGAPFALVPVREGDPDRIVETLSRSEPGNAVVVFDDRTTPAAYYLLAHGLAGWRLKRLTRSQVENKWSARQHARDQKARRKAERRWRDMIALSALDALDQMEAVPWRIPEFSYEGCLAIDVAEGRRYFGMSLLICRRENRTPSFLRVTRTWPKGDHQHEAINPEILRDKIVELFTAYSGMEFAPLGSLLILRDGGQCRDEPRGIREGVGGLREEGRLARDATVHVVDVHKRTAKHLRGWENTGKECMNVLEGQAVYLPDGRTAVVWCTGRATLPPHVTAEPCMLVATGEADIRRATRGYFALSQLNYSSPAKAYRCAQPLHESDARLQQRVAEDTRGVK